MSADLVEIVRAELVSKADELTVLVQVIQQANKQALQQARGELLKLNIERVALRKEIVHLRVALERDAYDIGVSWKDADGNAQKAFYWVFDAALCEKIEEQFEKGQPIKIMLRPWKDTAIVADFLSARDVRGGE